MQQRDVSCGRCPACSAMKKLLVILFVVVFASSFSEQGTVLEYRRFYDDAINGFEVKQLALLEKIKNADLTSEQGKHELKAEIGQVRIKLKATDLWLRYLEPVAYKRINGPLPVEWENEVFEKFERPYKREGSGLTLAELYLDEKNVSKDSLMQLIRLSANTVAVFKADSITRELTTFDHFFLCNRLYLLNLAAIYTTGFECPNSKRIIPELRHMCADVQHIYAAYNQSFPGQPVNRAYLALYDSMLNYIARQPDDYAAFDHYTFVKRYVNRLFAANQVMITGYNVLSRNNNDYTLSNTCTSIFDKALYTPQNTMGVYSLVTDKAILAAIRAEGKKLFYDPILSGNNSRSCASCHKPKQYFTDTVFATSLQMDGVQRLPRNTPSLINVVYNHLLMLDGKHISLQGQGKDVMTNPHEMGGNEQEILEKVLGCKEYKTAFRSFLKYIPEEKEVTIDHIVSAITFYYRDFSSYYSPFDEAMNDNRALAADVVRGFNLFMSKAQCGTCHFVPQFNGVHPPYIGSEFEVIGVPADTGYHALSPDSGRYVVNAAFETMHAFRTGTIRNAQYTKPYMHNGVFTTLQQVIDFYDAGGGAGRGLQVPNQSLSADSLHLTAREKTDLISFIHSLNENIIFEEPPAKLPLSSRGQLNERKVGGQY